MMNIYDALHEALIDYDEVEFMDDIELEGFLQDRLNDAEQEVLEKLGLYLEPNGSGSMGTFVIYDNDSNELAEISFEDYTDNELNIAFECNTIKQYQKKYTSWLKKLLPKKKKQLILYTCPEANPPGLNSDDYTSLPLRVHLRHKSSKSHFDQKFVREVIHVGDPDYGSLLSASYNAGWFFLDSWQEDLQKFLDKYHEYFPEYPSAEDFAPDSTTYFVVGEYDWDDDEDKRVGYVPVGNKMKKLGTTDKFPLPYEKCHYFRIEDEEGWNKIAAGHIVESLTGEVSESPLRQYSRNPHGKESLNEAKMLPIRKILQDNNIMATLDKDPQGTVKKALQLVQDSDEISAEDKYTFKEAVGKGSMNKRVSSLASYFYDVNRVGRSK